MVENLLGSGAAGTEEKKQALRQSAVAKTAIIATLAVGVVGIGTHAAQFGTLAQFVAISSSALLVGGAALLTGCLIGFLFGIPRSLQQESTVADGVATPSRAGGAEAPVQYRANTNLEQISDWFTKILVGVGLTQLTKVPGQLRSLANYLSPLLGNSEASGRFGVAACIYFAVSGFMLGYLWTRLALGGALRAADLAAIGARTAEVENKVEQLERQVQRDAEALSLTNRALNPNSDVPAPSQEQLNESVGAASDSVRVQIFYRAQEIRTDSWRDDKTKMARTIPVFRALIASDAEDRYHRNHGQLGYALKDQTTPDWKGAEAELSKAISLRGDARTTGWILYEYNRALCRIHLDPQFASKQPSAAEARKAVLEDLRVAATAPGARRLISDEPIIAEWLKLNKVANTDLT